MKFLSGPDLVHNQLQRNVNFVYLIFCSLAIVTSQAQISDDCLLSE